MSIEILYKKDNNFVPFLQAVTGKRVAILYDINTAPYAEPIREQLKGAGCLIANVPYRDVQLLPTEDRPLASTAEAIRTRYNERYSRYCSVADVIIPVAGDAESVASTIEKELI